MIDGKTVLSIIPARGGSKGLPDKNILPLGGKPLIAWSVGQALVSKLIDRVILSSDDDNIIEAARNAGCEIPFKRPAELASDEASTIDVVHHAMDNLPPHDYVVLLQPTSPLRTSDDIDKAVTLCHERSAHSCVSVCLADKSPYWMYSLGPRAELTPILKAPESADRRQDLPKIYALNGAIYVAEWDWLAGSNNFNAQGTIAYVMPGERSLDIDTELDFKLAELLWDNASRPGTVNNT